MSFEGYHQMLCKKGHQVNAGLDENLDTWKCPYCKSKCAWWNLVDLTNGSYEGSKRIDGYIKLKMIRKGKVCTCKSCGNVHNAEEPTYQIPKKGHRWNENK